MQDEEIWKDVVGHEGRYQVSNFGNVKSIGTLHSQGGRILKPVVKEGYFYVCLYGNNTKKIYSIHRLVAMAFIPNPNNKPCVDHIDGDRSNNRSENLRWVTYKENANNPISLSRNRVRGTKGYMYGKKHSEDSRIKIIAHLNKSRELQKKKVLQYTKDGKFIKVWGSISDAARFYNVSVGSIRNSTKGMKHYATEFVWKIVE